MVIRHAKHIPHDQLPCLLDSFPSHCDSVRTTRFYAECQIDPETALRDYRRGRRPGSVNLKQHAAEAIRYGRVITLLVLQRSYERDLLTVSYSGSSL